ncbi:sulfur carrier protein ThiS [Veronia pacifica]|uniref:Thiamine biosynthesis protein ThiS n=1 Tax=Veronia pacifica TaxID=1080227 RepID=A0A1C3EJJ7_9GAMM|nr:sulfur carrier protein ThiS [Veronia pacifica]ODA33399.1 thiamine biosynthesis protein ThiS [Veronia pacifica]
MQIVLNESPHTPESATDLAALIQELALPSESVAIAVEGAVIPRSQWAEVPLTEGLRLTVFQAIAGG